MRTRPLACALLLAFAPAIVPVSAFAQPSDDAITQEVRTRFREGVDLFDQGHYEAARAKFKQAYALKPLPDILYNLAWSSLKSGHPVDAEREFQRYLREAKDIDPQQKDEATKGLADAKTKNGHIEIAAPPNADVFVDGERVGTSPIGDPVPVEPGAHVVKYAPGDAAPQSQSISVLAGQTQVARFGGSAAPPPPATTAPTPPAPADTGHPSDTSTPPAAPPDDTSHGEGTTPSTPAAGTEEHVSSGKSIFAPPANMTPVIIGGVVTLAGLVTGVVMLLVKNNAQNNADSVANQITAHGGHNGTCGPPPASGFEKACATLQDDVNAVNNDATAGNIAVGIGLAGLVFTGVYWLAATKADEGAATRTSRTWVAPILTAREGGMSFGGSF